MAGTLPVHEAMREAREKAEWSLRYLSDVSGVSRSNISQYERGDVTPSIYNLIALADALGLTLDEYVGHTPKDRWTGKKEAHDAEVH